MQRPEVVRGQDREFCPNEGQPAPTHNHISCFPTVGKEFLGSQPDGLPEKVSEESNQLLRHLTELMD